MQDPDDATEQPLHYEIVSWSSKVDDEVTNLQIKELKEKIDWSLI